MDAAVPGGVLGALRPRAPEAVVRALEHHFAAALFGGAECPSPWLARRLWEAAVRPRREGHGAARPWARDRDFRDAGMAGAARSASWRALSGWRRWLAAVAG